MFGAMGREVPIILVFLSGVGLRRSGLMKASDGSALLRLVFCAGLPAVIVQSFLAARVDVSYVVLALFPPVVIVVTLAVVMLLRRSSFLYPVVGTSQEEGRPGLSFILRRLVASPPLWAIALGCCSLSG